MDEALDWRISKNLNIALCKECGFTYITRKLGTVRS
jgi:hypothetical protein